ncbi:MAG: MmgE/PrpD family protein [Planctomycetota bacterium]|nr:MmgE/PrpD family protein [Planctomycetota bacterium]MDA1106424.1 MmgE/PrpD family protein [Planctomycetota bacterium]
MSSTTLARNTNQALGIGQFAIHFMRSGTPSAAVMERTKLFHADAVLCGLSALAMGTNAPRLLRAEALQYPLKGSGATVFGSRRRVQPEKAVVANSSAVREWDSNGTNFGFCPERGHTAGEFGHNDFYPVAIAACQSVKRDGETALRTMVLIDEIRGRLAEVFSLKSYKIDHVVHGAIASAAGYGAVMGATAEQIESAIGMVVAHTIPWRAIRAGKQLSDSKGASAAISAEAAILFMRRSMEGFLGPRDIFRNPESMFRRFEPTKGDSPFDLILSQSGDDFAVMGMHFKLGLYEHQSAGALQGLVDLLRAHPEALSSGDAIKAIKVIAYEPAFGIIGDPAKQDPRTRQSADHSMLYIVSTMLRKALEARAAANGTAAGDSNDDWWCHLMLGPHDYAPDAIDNALTRSLMEKISFEHGGKEYDAKYPDGIPTSIQMTLSDGTVLDSGLVMYPSGHARNTTADLRRILDSKFDLLGSLALENPRPLVKSLMKLETLGAKALRNLWDFKLLDHGRFD